MSAGSQSICRLTFFSDTPVCSIGDGDALQAQVQRLKDDILRSSTASTTEGADSDDQYILVPSCSDEESSSDEEMWSTPDDTFSLIAAMTAASEVRTTSNSLLSMKSDYGDQNPQVTSDVQSHRNTDGPEESTHTFANSETTRSAQGDQGAEEFFEKTQGAADWNTLKELSTSSETFQKQGPRIKIPRRSKCHDPLATTPMLSSVPGGNSTTSKITCPAPKKSDKSGVTRASRVSEHSGLAANAQTVAKQPRASAPMAAVRYVTPARRATQAAANGVHDTVTGCPTEVEAACGFAALYGLTIMVMAGVYTCIFGLH